MKKRFFLIFFSILVAAAKPQVNNISSALAIVVDKETYNKVGSAVDKYKEAVEKDGLIAYLVINEWKDPSEVRMKLQELYKNTPSIEGAVFIGDIPIPMIRTAQHLTSAFKMDEEKYPFQRSSVPSDRYYDDFDLIFKFISQDSTNKLLFYYSLLSESPQKIQKEIYTARIKPPVNDDSKYQLIEKYLIKAVLQKQVENPVNDMFVFTGHGYHSESLDSWADERLSLNEQFPDVFRSGGRIKNFSHEMSNDMKEIIFRELQRPELDIAIFHAHGNPDMQYLLDYPENGGISGDVESIKLFLRSKVRSAKKPEETKDYFKKEYGVPDSWFEGAFIDSVIASDSLLGYSLDIYSADLDNISPQAEFVMFDECFNGSFHKENYIAGKYIFGNGRTIVAEANTVNVLQDKWSDENLGLLNKGVRVGLWHKYNNLLESHLIGDPTYKFSGDEEVISDIMRSENLDFLKSNLKDSDPINKCLAIESLAKLPAGLSAGELVEIYKTDPSVNVRMHALKNLAIIGGEPFYDILKISINDPYELIRRFSTVWLGEVGKEDYLPFLLNSIIEDQSERVTFNAKNSLLFFDNEKTKEFVKQYFSSHKDSYSVKVEKDLISSLTRNYSWIHDEILPKIKNDTLKLKERIQEIKTFRNYHFHEAIPDLLFLAQDNSQNEKIRTAILEALGWFSLYYNKAAIESVCIKIIDDNSSSHLVKQEALRTKARLTGLNNIFIP